MLPLTCSGVDLIDLNYLLFRHQVSLMRADAATTIEARIAHQGLVRGYRRRIGEMQRATGAAMAL